MGVGCGGFNIGSGVSIDDDGLWYNLKYVLPNVYASTDDDL